MVKLRYNWKYEFVRPTVDEVCKRYKVKHAPRVVARWCASAACPAADVPAGQGGRDLRKSD
eukprot:1239382-Prymnesium_polylepis.1